MLCASCTGGDHAVSRARSIGPHLGALRSIIHAFKYDGRRSLARPLAQMMRDAGEDLLEEATVVVPVPLHPQRRRERGFNQATDLARYMGPPVSHALRRVRRTPTQTGLPATARQANVRRAFRTTWRARRLRGATVLLVDDVSTTGATLAACAQALKVDGVAKVLAITAARADP